MSYYRYITGIYKSYWPELNRPLRSSSVPRHVPEPVPYRNTRASSVPINDFYQDPCSISRRSSVSPFRERALSVPRQISYSSDTRSIWTPSPSSDYSDFDYKVLDYMNRLGREDTVRNTVNRSIETRSRQSHTISDKPFSYQYDYYDSNKHSDDYLYSMTKDVFGYWKHFNISADTLNLRNMRAKSPMVTRELNRYYEKKPNYVGDMSAAGCDFRHYNYRRVPYFGGSDEYKFMKTHPFQGGRGF